MVDGIPRPPENETREGCDPHAFRAASRFIAKVTSGVARRRNLQLWNATNNYDPCTIPLLQSVSSELRPTSIGTKVRVHYCDPCLYT